jgi:hypothetical protein
VAVFYVILIIFERKNMTKFNLLILLFFSQILFSQTDSKLYEIIDGVSSKRIEKDVTILANFETRNTFSDTISNTRGIGAARRQTV